MGTLERTLRLLDVLGLFIITRFPFIELFMLLMATGEQAEKTPFGRITNFKDTFRQEYFLVYLNAAIFFVCGTGMTLDFKRRRCGFAAAAHEIVYTVIILYQQKRYSEYLIVSNLTRNFEKRVIVKSSTCPFEFYRFGFKRNNSGLFYHSVHMVSE